MATDVFIRQGLNTRQMAEVAEKYRHEFGVAYVELVNIVEILEFKIPEVYPGFSLIIRKDSEMRDYAFTEILDKKITVKESVYIGACEGDAFCRYTLAHELGHFLLHSSKRTTLHKTPDTYTQTISGMNSVESGEKQADMFARHFLAPPKISKKYKNNYKLLAEKTGVPEDIARGNIRISKRPELWRLTSD